MTRKTFYELLQESLAQKPRIVLLSTHLIDEVATVAERLIIIDQGRLLLYVHMNEVDEKAYSVTGPAAFVEQAVAKLNVIGETRAGGFVSKFVFDTRIEGSDQYAVAALGLQDFFVSLVGDGAKGERTA